MIKRVLPFLLLAIVAIVMAVATVVEHFMGTDAAYNLIYGSLWFDVLWGAVTVSALYLIYIYKLWKRPFVLLLHLSFVVILVGAFVTHVTSRTGFMHLMLKDAASTYWVKRSDGLFEGKQLPFLLCLKDFNIEYDEGTDHPKDYISNVLIVTHEGQEEATISMNHIARVKGYRIYQTSYDDDLTGSVFTINYDPWGTPITFFGYALLALSMVLAQVSRNQQPPRPPKGGDNREGGNSNIDDNAFVIEDIKVTTGKTHALLSPPLGGRGGCPWLRGGCPWLRVRLSWSLFFSAFIGILLASYMVIALAFRPLVPVLRSPLLVIHVGVIMISYVLLIVSMVRRSVLRMAVFMLAAGIFLGAIWASISWGTYWSWDPKESWALVTLIVYSIPLHQQTLPWFRSDRHYRLYSVLALLCLLMTYFGVTFLMGGMHSYVG